jgi:hypothetical protein
MNSKRPSSLLAGLIFFALSNGRAMEIQWTWVADQLEVRLAKARGQVDQLTPSLLARAFAGQLVTQDPADEPAEKLLERIRQEGPRIARMTRMKKGKAHP